MFMVEVATVTDLTTLMVTMRQDLPTWVDLNHHHITSQTIHIDTNLTQRGDLVVTDQETATEAQEVAKVLL
jgi:hypothetical protein